MERLRAGKSHGELGVWKISLAPVLEGIERGVVSKGKHQGWEMGVCTGLEPWEREEVQVGEKPRMLNWLALAGTGWLQRAREGAI